MKMMLLFRIEIENPFSLQNVKQSFDRLPPKSVRGPIPIGCGLSFTYDVSKDAVSRLWNKVARTCKPT